ncbi:MAG: acetate--CoA ligase family protein [Actinomycetota bacterium]
MPKDPPVDVSGRPLRLRDVDLDPFFHPRAIAVIGASEASAKPNTAMTRKLEEWARRHGANFFPVHPTYDTVLGHACFRSVFDAPGELDLAIILTRHAVETFEEVCRRGAKFAVIFAAGFSETGAEGRALEDRLAALVRAGAVRLLGPNTNLNAFEDFRDDLDGPSVALITQSGHQGRPVFQGQQLGIRLTHWAPTGNEVDLEFADFARYFADQADVGVVACYIEGFKDGRTLMLAADHAARTRTPIVMVKIGRTKAGRSMAASHTGHLTGTDEVISAVFRQFGVTRVSGLDGLLEVSASLARTRPVNKLPAWIGREPGVCVYAISGGTGAHMADVAAHAGLHLPELTSASQAILHDGLIPTYLRVSNPVDCGGPPVADARGRKILDVLLADPNVDVLIVPITGAVETFSEPFTRDIVDAGQASNTPIFVVWGAPPGTDDTYYKRLLDGGLPVFRTFDNCVTAVRAYADYWSFSARYHSPFADAPTEPLPAAKKARALLEGVSSGAALNEYNSKRVLAAYGIKTTKDVRCESAAAAVKAARSIGFPVVMKVSSPDLAHKSEAGLVAVAVTSVKEVRVAYDDLLNRAKRADRRAHIEGVLVCEMMTGGVEMLLGITHDELFGPVVTVGLGGIFVEVFGDVTFRVPPFDEDEAGRMLRELRGYRLLGGTRGARPADVDALVRTIMKVQRLAMDLAGDVRELDINPLLVRSRGVVALDALVVKL